MAVAEYEARFTQRVMAVIEETATPEELAEFQALLREHPEFKLQYMEQMRIHGLSCYRALSLRQQRDGGTRSEEGPLLSSVTRTEDVFSRRGVLRKTGSGWRAAAAAVLLLGGIAIWQSVSPTAGLRPPTSGFPSCWCGRQACVDLTSRANCRARFGCRRVRLLCGWGRAWN